jgi:hypothetical protein
MPTTYTQAQKHVESKGCRLLWSESEYLDKFQSMKTKILIESTCGHQTEVQLTNFIYHSNGVKCKDCIYQEFKDRATGDIIDYHVREYDAFLKLQTYCSSGAIVFKKCVEGCRADFCIKPVSIEEDLWMPMQLKTTQRKSHGFYSFTCQNTYHAMYVLFYALDDEIIWVMDGEQVGRNMTLGRKNSKTNEYIVDKINLEHMLLDLYASTHYTMQLCDINIAICKETQRSHEFSSYRDKQLPQLKYEYPKIDNRVYDVIINGRFKVQEKVIGTYKKRNGIAYYCKLNRGRDRIVQYKVGDNDYYWLHLPNKEGAYILPQDVLLVHGYISNQPNTEIVKSSHTLLYPYGSNSSNQTYWFNEHLYIYNNKEHIERLCQLFA